MVSGIDAYSSGILGVGALRSVRTGSSSGKTFGMSTDEPERPGPGTEDSPVKGIASGADTKITISGSVTYETVSLLADLSGPSAPAKPSGSLEAFSSAETYRRLSSESLEADDEVIPARLTYTFEIIV